ncbi:DNA-binding transcriptional regulator, LysR family [Kushneria avicenniae]|uniref:DNA-binding transcriptional regulator, LysR family n=1 Tax=Kushneria avicenniae TaxID=402385 RepID=A0A1I1GD55_9GAMM|nr:LysR family transcriptional regulator [Kushneria avicenniae]SFC07040.1 DNA-binding transcriptional regulator, LysR family [Kushneria avicenniae]
MNAGDRFSGIEAFVASAGAGSFTAAARTLGMTPSGVAKSVSRLEARIGLKLLHRTTRQISLTPEGKAYLGACRQAIGELDEMEAALASDVADPLGRVRITMPAAFGRRHVLPSLFELARCHPGLDLCVSLTERTLDLVAEGLDLAVRIGELDDDGDLVARRLGTERLVTCAAPAYLGQSAAIASPEDLRYHDCIVGPPRAATSSWVFHTPEREVTRQALRVRHQFNDGESMLAAALAGCGVIQMPTWLVGEYLHDGRLIPVLEDVDGCELPIHAVWPKSAFLPPRVRVVIDLLERLASRGDSGFAP